MLGSSAYIVGHESSFFLIIGSASDVGQDYEQNGVGKKRGTVRLDRLSGRKMFNRSPPCMIVGSSRDSVGQTHQKMKNCENMKRKTITNKEVEKKIKRSLKTPDAT